MNESDSTKYSYAYADESGDTGYQFGQGSSTHFILTIVLPEQPERTIDQLIALRRKLGKPSTYEFHFRKTDSKARDSFFESVRGEPIKLLVANIHKTLAPNDFRRLGRLGMYSHALAGLGLRSPFVLSNCKLHLDGSGKHKQFLQALKSNIRLVCRAAGHPEQSFGEIRIIESAHPLIQYADMITGAVVEMLENNNSKWFTVIEHQITVLWHERFE